VKNWNSRTANADLTINGMPMKPCPDFRQGTTIDTDGTYTLLIWVGMHAKSMERFTISKAGMGHTSR